MSFDPTMDRWPIKLFIFDMDGTLIDSGLDFNAMREELAIAPEENILSAIQKQRDPAIRLRMAEIISRHEWEGAKRCSLIDGAQELLAHIESRGYSRAILTRNRKDVTQYCLEKFDLKFDLVLAREDVKQPKPHPEGLHRICQELGVSERESLYLGDYEHDLVASNAAGTFTVLYGRDAQSVDRFGHLAKHTVTQLIQLIEKIG